MSTDTDADLPSEGDELPSLHEMYEELRELRDVVEDQQQTIDDQQETIDELAGDGDVVDAFERADLVAGVDERADLVAELENEVDTAIARTVALTRETLDAYDERGDVLLEHLPGPFGQPVTGKRSQ